MQVQKINNNNNNLTFGKIILNCNNLSKVPVQDGKGLVGEIVQKSKASDEKGIPAKRLLEVLPIDQLLKNMQSFKLSRFYAHSGYLLDIKAIFNALQNKPELQINDLIDERLNHKENFDKSYSIETPELQFLHDTISELIIHDFLLDDGERELLRRFAELVEQQEDNPHDIYLDVFPEDKGEIPIESYRWYQKAIVGDKTFWQRLHPGEGNAIQFLEDACEHANKLWGKNVAPEETATQTTISLEENEPRPLTLRAIASKIWRTFFG